MKCGRISSVTFRLTFAVLGCTSGLAACWAQAIEIPDTFPETRAGLVAEFDSPKDLDPFIPQTEIKRTLPDRMLILWLTAFVREEQDLKRLVAETIAEAHRGGEKLDDTIQPLLEEFARTGANKLTLEAVAGALVELDARDAADAFIEKVDQASWRLSLTIELAVANWQDQRMEAVWLQRLAPEFSDKGRQRLAIECLGTLKSTKAVSSLSKMAESQFQSHSLRIAAAMALSQIGDPTNVGLAEALVSPRRGSKVDRLIAARVLRGQASQAASDMLVELAQDQETSVTSVAAKHLLETNPQLVKPLALSLSASSNANARTVALRAFAHEPVDTDVQRLLEMLADQHPPIRQEAAKALQSLAKSGEFVALIDNSMIDIVRTADSENDWRQLEQAIGYVGELDRKAAAPLLIRHLRSKRNQVFLPAAWALRKLSVEETFNDSLAFIVEAVAKLRGRVADAYLEAQLSQLCQMYGTNHYEPAVGVLKTFIPKAVKNRGEQARAAAIWALGHIYENRAQPDLAAQLVERLNDIEVNNPELFGVRAASAVAIARMGHKDKLPELREWLTADSVDGIIGYSCAWGIHHLTGEPIPRLETRFYKKQGWFFYPAVLTDKPTLQE